MLLNEDKKDEKEELKQRDTPYFTFNLHQKQNNSEDQAQNDNKADLHLELR